MLSFTDRSTVLFDLDGTILDSSVPVLAAWNHAFDVMGLAPMPVTELSRVLGPSTQLVAPTLLAERGRPDAAALDEFIPLFRASIVADEVRLAVAYDGVVALLAELRAAGRGVSVVTAKPLESAARVLPALGIEHLVEHLFAPTLAAPEPKHVTMGRALTTLGLTPEQTVLVGDRFHDVEAALHHGVATIGVAWAGHASVTELREAGAAVVVERVEDLRALLLA